VVRHRGLLAAGRRQKGSSKRNQVQGPSLRTVDLSLFKTFRFASRYGLELRFECFNVTNTPQ